MELKLYKKYINQIKEIIDQFDDFKSIVYAIITAKRFYPFYVKFSTNESFGKPKLLINAQEFAIEILKNPDKKINTDEIKDLNTKIDSIIPDSDDYSDCSDAMDSSIIHYYLLDYIIKKNKENIIYIANYVYDLCDRYAQDSLEITSFTDKTEAIIEQSPVIIENISNEIELLQLINNIRNNQINVDQLINDNVKCFLHI
jgi:uncharacterized protein YjaG (DUF416 family)